MNEVTRLPINRIDQHLQILDEQIEELEAIEDRPMVMSKKAKLMADNLSETVKTLVATVKLISEAR